MKAICRTAKALYGYFKTLVRPSFPIQGRSLHGHTVLAGWQDAPEEKLILSATQLKNQKHREIKLACFCYEGPHAGELIFLGKEMETLGKDSANSIVLTPSDRENQSTYKLMLNDMPLLMTEKGDLFKLNGRTSQKAELFDFDELEILGNKLLVLSLDKASGEELSPQLEATPNRRYS